MTADAFIFSEKNTDRIKRHTAFWLVFILYFFMYRFYLGDIKMLSVADTYFIRLKNMLLFLPVSFFYAYLGIYFLLPRYMLTGKYVQLIAIIIVISLGFMLLSYWLTTMLDIKLGFDLPIARAEIIRRIDFIYTNGFVLPFVVSGFAVGIKMSKNFYLQQKRNEQLSKQKTDAEVQLFKSQVHPRFLFHSLHSIYNDMLHGAQQSPDMLLMLSELLSYILYESDKPMPVKKELQLLTNYIALEKAGWKKNLAVNIQEDVADDEQYIEPLLLLPMAEYVFSSVDKKAKHKMDLFLNIKLQQQELYFTISSKSIFTQPNSSDDAQLLQVQKRLQAQYPDQHKLTISYTEDTITIFLSLHLKNNQLTNII